MRLRVAGLVALMAAVAGNAGAADDPLAGFGWYRDVAGACWTALLPGGTMRDTQCYEVRLGRFLHGTIRLEKVEAPAPAGAPALPHAAGLEGESICAWDAAGQRISCWLWASDGTFTPGEARFEGERLVWPHARKPGSTAPEQRSVWTRVDASSYRVAREKREGERWVESFAVTYMRVPQR